MPRLTTSQWEQARAEYEVRTDRTLTDVAAQFGVDRSSMSLRAKREGWQRGKLHGLVLKKVKAFSELGAADEEIHALGVTRKMLVDRVVRERLEEAGAIAALGKAIARKGMEILKKVETPDEWETMTRGKRNLNPPPVAPAKGDTTTVNVQANAQSAAAAAHEPRPRPLPEAIETMRRLLRGE